MKKRRTNTSLEIHPKLTKRELQVLARFAKGDTYSQIARRFGISIYTVREHARHCRKKLVARNRLELALWAIRELGM